MVILFLIIFHSLIGIFAIHRMKVRESENDQYVTFTCHKQLLLREWN